MTKTKDNFFKPILPKRNSEYIANQIEEAILEKIYIPGDKLPTERELAAQFNVGRGAIREAIRIIDATGYIEVKHGGDGGIYVREFDSSRMMKSVTDLVRLGNISHEDVTEVRIAIEAGSIESSFNLIGEEEIAKLEDNIKRCEVLIKKNESIYTEIQEFHVLLSSFSKNRLSQYILESLVEISRSYIPKIKNPVSHTNQHKAILTALKKKDMKKAKTLLETHLSRIGKIVKNTSAK